MSYSSQQAASICSELNTRRFALNCFKRLNLAYESRERYLQHQSIM